MKKAAFSPWLGIAGPAGSGKDTSGEYLERMFGYSRVAFATKLKAMLAAAGIHQPEDKNGPTKFGFSYRKAIQTLGTEWGRALDHDLWVKLVAADMEYCYDDRVVFTDVRFDNEAEWIRRSGGRIIHLSGRAYNLADNATHASEAGVAFVEGVDVAIVNDGTDLDLYNKLHCLGIHDGIHRR